ncbi:MAG: MFS transporter [Acidimicrobiia bacterium]|nr:MFS transporter [Acidimicrobiia bacterium]NNC74800.1 MFS transporter [Acidimicrobiia bacterium]
MSSPDPHRPLPLVLAFLAFTRLVVNTAHRFVFPFLPAISRGLGISLEQGGILMSARSLAGVATPLVVASAGRGERRLRLAVWGLGLMAVGALVTAATSAYVGAFAGFILLGLGKPSFDSAAVAYVADRTPYDRRARYLSVLELTWAGGLLVGAPAAGLLIDRFGWEAPFWVIGLILAATMAVSPLVLERDEEHTDSGGRPLSLDRSSVALLIVAGLFSVSAEVTFIVYGAWLEDEFALSLAALGAASVVIALAELAGEGSVLVFADRFGKRRMVAWGMAASAIGYLALVVASGSLVGGIAALSMAFIAFEVTIVGTVPLASEAAPGARTRYLALLMVALSIGRAIGDVIGPMLYTWKGIPANGITSAAVVLVGLALLLGAVRERS